MNLGLVSELNGNKILLEDNLIVLQSLQRESVNLIYIDPPFNTGKKQKRQNIKVNRADKASFTGNTRVGFGGHKYSSTIVGESEYEDSFVDYIGFLRPRLAEAYKILKPNGSLFFHIDWREAARCRLLLEEIFGGNEYCINEIIWSYDFGGRSKTRWPAKHDNIYWFAKNPKEYIFNYDTMDRIPYLAPGLVGKEKAAIGKTPTDVWWNTIVPTNGKEKQGYATQKPLAIVERLVKIHSNPGDTVLDFFAGSGTLGEAAVRNKRKYILIDNNSKAYDVMVKRLQLTNGRGRTVDHLLYRCRIK